MDQTSCDQLDRMLALADSAHEGEAAAAVNKARQLLARHKLSFGDLARSASARLRSGNRSFSLFNTGAPHMEAQIAHLQNKIDTLANDMEAQTIQLDFWRRRAAELEQSVNLNLAEAQRWRTLAQETVEKLWDLSQNMQDGDKATFQDVKTG